VTDANDQATARTAIPPEFDELIAAEQGLPDCDRAAKLHALVARLLHSVRTGADPAAAAEALAAAAVAALAEDPWVRFEIAVRQIHAQLAAATAAPAAEPEVSRIAPGELA
jgi:hypothetical protein